MIYVGTKGWEYKTWEREGYIKSLSQYASIFETVEVSKTKYSLSVIKQLERIRVPTNFKYSIYLYQKFTVFNKFKIDTILTQKWLNSLHNIKDNVRNIIIEFPKTMSYDVSFVYKIKKFLNHLPRQFTYVLKDFPMDRLTLLGNLFDFNFILYNEINSLQDLVLISQNNNYIVFNIDNVSDKELDALFDKLIYVSERFYKDDLFLYFTTSKENKKSLMLLHKYSTKVKELVDINITYSSFA